MRSFFWMLFLSLGTALALAACDNPLANAKPVLATDTLTLTAPSSDSAAVLPSAIDLTVGNLGRFPERVQDAGAWDVAVRALADGTLRFLPTPTSPNGRIGAGINGPRPEPFETYSEAPQRSQYGDTAVTIVQGKMYVVRSRQYNEPAIGAVCTHFSKILPLAVNNATGTVQVVVTTNAGCSDRRLTPDG